MSATAANGAHLLVVDDDQDLLRLLTMRLHAWGYRVSTASSAEEGLARIAVEVNRSTENIGARRLYTIMETLLEDISFDAPDLKEKKIVIDAKYVEEKLDNIVEDEDLSRYIL